VAFPWDVVGIAATSVGDASVGISPGFEVGNGAVGMAPGGAGVEGMGVRVENEIL
jgi:hypothetical protein